MNTTDIINSRKYEEAFAIEQVYFVKTDRRVNPRKVEPFKYVKGSKPILITAPHAVRHIRKKKIKPSELFTGSLACLLAELTGCHALCTTKLYGGDPNYDEKCIFKDRVKKIVWEENIGIIIDLHGAGELKEFDIDIGTMQGKSLLGDESLRTKLKNKFLECGINKISYDFFPAKKQYTITRFAAEKLEIPALQIEINRKFRAPNGNGIPFNRVLAALMAYILEV